MTLLERLKDLILELDRVHPNGSVDLKAWELDANSVLPNFVLAESGVERWFTQGALHALADVAAILHENDARLASMIQLEQFRGIFRTGIANLHATGELDLSVHDAEHIQCKIWDMAWTSASGATRTFTHYFPSWTLGMEAERPFVLGPVTFMTVDQWVDSVDFGTDTLQRYLDAPTENARWKSTLRGLLARRRKQSQEQNEVTIGLASSVYSALGECPSILKIAVSGHEFHLSRKIGEMICKSALDGVTLQLGRREHFYQQVLGHEHLPPFSVASIAEMNGELLQLGSAWGPRLRIASYQQVRDAIAGSEEYLAACGTILRSMLGINGAAHPQLAKRWTTALDWFAEGQRERNDAVALTKIATSLDVLSCGGRFRGILAMLVNLLDVDEGCQILSGRRPQALAQVVRNIYDKGRSQILHGTEFDRIKSFEATRSHAAYLAGLALREAALRLSKFTGVDGDTDFRSMA